MNTDTSFARSFRSRTVRIALFLLAALALTSPAFCGPIHDAAQKGDLNKVKALVQSDPKVVTSKDKNGNTPLHLAAFHDHAAVAEFLLANGAEVNAKNSYSSFVPDDLEGMFAANDANHKDPQDLLLAKGEDAKASTNGYTPLDLALFSYNHKDVVALLLAKGADVNAKDQRGFTPLYYAKAGDLGKIVDMLRKHGAHD
jgi:ankyrin repeat protein